MQRHILVIDDNQSVCNLVTLLAESIGHKVTSCLDSTEALELFSVDMDSFDLVITDLMMPVLDGSELCRRIQEINPEIPIIVMTGQARYDTDTLRREMDICDIIAKPFRINEMRTLIQRRLETNAINQS